MRRRAIVLVTQDTRFAWNPFFLGGRRDAAANGVLQYFRDYPDRKVLCFGLPAPSAQVLPTLDDIRPANTDGVVIVGGQWREIAQRCQEQGVPVVATNWFRRDTDIPTVRHDDLAIGRMAAEYFLRRGFRSLAFCGPHYLAIRQASHSGALEEWMEKRRRGFEEAARAAEADCSVLCDPRENVATESESACCARFSRDMRQWVRALRRPVGILVCADLWAEDCLRACEREGLNVPRDVAVLGVDNDTLRCEASRPTLSSIDRDMPRIGYETAKLLDRFLSTGDWGAYPVLVAPSGVAERVSTETLAIANARLVAALRFVRSRFHDPITTHDVARAAGVSESWLRVGFQRELGFTLASELRRLRLERARNLLATSDLPLKTVAEAAGFGSAVYLCRTFAEEFGISPGKWRQSCNRASERRLA